MFYFNTGQKEELIEHARREFPNEVCGILAGKDGGVSKIYQMSNTDKSSSTFFMDPKQQLKVMKEIRGLGLEMLGIYHSHPELEAYPSTHDVKMAFYPEVEYIIVSIKDKANPSIRSYKIIDGKITEEKINIK